MSRPVKKNVYERIDEQKNKIQETETLLKKLNDELQELYAEKDDSQMRQLLKQMKDSGLSIDQAMKLLQK